MASVFDKVMGLLGVREETEEEVIEMEDVRESTMYEDSTDTVNEKRGRKEGNRRNNLVSLAGGTKQTKVMIVEPEEFEEVRTLVDYLKSKSPVILRLHQVERNEAKRIVDFMSGATYALNGSMRKLGDTIFFFAPHSVVIEGEMETTLFELGDKNE